MKTKKPQPNEFDDVLKRILATPPQPHVQNVKKAAKTAKKRGRKKA